MKNYARVPSMRFRLFFLLMTILLASGIVAAAEVEIKYAKGFQVETLDGCTLITVTPKWRKNAPMFRYLLVPKGGTPPKNHPPAQIVTVPVKRVAALSTTFLAYMDAAGIVERLKGVSSFKHVNTPSVRKRIEAGELREVGHSTTLRIEALLELSPDLILTPASGTLFDAHPKLLEAGLPTAIVIEHLEADPLARCEWIKFKSLFFGTYNHAKTLFNEIEARYKALARKTANISHPPAVLTNVPFQGQWWIPGGGSYIAHFIKDAGGNYLWKNEGGTGSIAYDIEAVYDRALTADFWINTGTWKRYNDAIGADPRFADIKALKENRMYNNNKQLNAAGGNDYWESGMLHPDVVLADLIWIMHPDLLPGHTLVYYRHLGRSEAGAR